MKNKKYNPPYKITLSKDGKKIEHPEPIKYGDKVIKWGEPFYNAILFYGKHK